MAEIISSFLRHANVVQLLVLAQILACWSFFSASPWDPIDPCSFDRREGRTSICFPSRFKFFVHNAARWFAFVLLRTAISTLLLALTIRGDSTALLAIVSLFLVFVPVVRLFLLNPRIWFLFEAAQSSVFVGVTSYLVWTNSLTSVLSSSTHQTNLRVAIILMIATTFYSMWQQSTYFVRGVLFISSSMPPGVPMEAPVQAFALFRAPRWMTRKLLVLSFNDREEFHRGYIIGILERMLIVVLVAAGQYQALAFLSASKALMRNKDLEDREYSDYVLLGSLASAIPAFVAGFIIGKIYLPLLLNATP